jgi:nucleotide-binding universal stress UspA family protein
VRLLYPFHAKPAYAMTTLLVLTDFSATAQSATQYAARLTQQLPARLILLHAVPRHSQWLGDLDDELVREARLKLQNAKDQLVGQGLPAEAILTDVINQFPLDKVAADYAKASQASLIVMGTRGVSRKEPAVLGSYVIDVMEFSPVPVLAVPDDVPMKGLSRIVYATDLQQVLVEMSILVPYARAFGASVDVLHVARPGGDTVPAGAELLTQLRESNAYERISFSVRPGKDLKEAIHGFTRETEADLLAVFAHPQNIFEKLFSRSLSEQISNYALVPVLVFRK